MTKKKTTQPTEIPPLLQLLGDEMTTNPPSQPQTAVARRDKVDNHLSLDKFLAAHRRASQSKGLRYEVLSFNLLN